MCSAVRTINGFSRRLPPAGRVRLGARLRRALASLKGRIDEPDIVKSIRKIAHDPA
jgi:hypothetical protein